MCRFHLSDEPRLDRAITSCTTSLDIVGIDAWYRIGCELAKSALLAAVEVDIFDVEGMNVTWNVAEECEANVDKKVGTAACDHEDANRRDEDGDEDDEKSWCSVGHFVSLERVRRC